MLTVLARKIATRGEKLSTPPTGVQNLNIDADMIPRSPFSSLSLSLSSPFQS